jgi:tetratricopeptide (TPR) repeat protein
MFKFARSKRILFVVGTVGLLLVIALWRRSAPDRRLKAEAKTSPLSCALYAARKSGYYNSEIIRKAAVAFAETGDFNRAQLIINEVEETDYFVFSHPGLRFHFSQQLDFNLENKAKALATVAGLYARTGRKDKALETLSHALQIGDRIESDYCSNEALAEISSKYVEFGADSQALKIIEFVKPKHFVDGTEELTPYNHWLRLKLANQYLDVGRSDQAFGILERARSKIDAIKDTSQKSKVLAEIGTVYAKAGQSHKANELLSEALEVITAATSQSEPYKSMALTIVAEEYAKSGFCQRAYEVSNTITIEHNRSDTLRRVGAICSKDSNTETLTYSPPEPEIEAALKLIETGEREKGLQAIQNFGRQYATGRALVDAATRLAQDGKYDLALEVTRAIVSDGTGFEDAPNVTSQEYRAEAVATIAIFYARTGPKEERERRKFLRQSLTLIE